MRNGIFVVALFCACSTVLAQERPLPLDPLTPAEREAVIRIAQNNPRVRELLGGEARVVTAFTIGVKRTPAEAEPTGRSAIVLFIRGDNAAGVEVLVDVDGGSVSNAVRLSPKSVPLGIADVELALRIFRESPQARTLLGERLAAFHTLSGPVTAEDANGDIVQGLQTIGGGPDNACARNRCVALLFEHAGQLLFPDRTIIVDLNQRNVSVATTRTTREVH